VRDVAPRLVPGRGQALGNVGEFGVNWGVLGGFGGGFVRRISRVLVGLDGVRG
jgi:hypothetical protein